MTKNFGFMGIGPATGAVLGLAVGQSFEDKYIKEAKIRPLTESDKSKRKISITVWYRYTHIGCFCFFLMYFRE
ncbi:MAG: hypothetical protein JXB49_15310 [Bacteroidales bacterium]|nr:hypothetical protein [Bacteroidales bacterium]